MPSDLTRHNGRNWAVSRQAAPGRETKECCLSFRSLPFMNYSSLVAVR